MQARVNAAARGATQRVAVAGGRRARLQLHADDGEVLLESHVVEARRLVGIGDDVTRPVARVRLSARIDHAGPLEDARERARRE